MLALLFGLPRRGHASAVASLLIGTPAVSAVGAIGASLTLSLKRGGLILPLIILPLLAPAVIFGAGAVSAALDGLPNGALGLLAAFSAGGGAACRPLPPPRACGLISQARAKEKGYMPAHVPLCQSRPIHAPFRRAAALGLASLAADRAGAGPVLWAFASPPDYQQGMTVTIMFVHVPAAIVAEWRLWPDRGRFAVLAGLAPSPGRYRGARRRAAGGAVHGAGPDHRLLWGRPMWGAYWVWDARLTSFLLLLFLYLGYIALWNAIEDETRAARAAAILALVGAVNLPIIKFSVDWWNTLHQGESILSAARSRRCFCGRC